MRVVNFVFTAMIVVAAAASEAYSSNWSMNGASCVPGDPAIQNNSHFITGGSLSHKTGATGLITLYCPISGTWGVNRPTILWMTYANSDTNIANIKAQVIRLSASNGALNAVSQPLSNASLSTIGHRVGLNFSHTFDFKNNYYYVRVDITRSNTTAHATLFGVSLSCQTCPAN